MTFIDSLLIPYITKGLNSVVGSMSVVDDPDHDMSYEVTLGHWGPSGSCEHHDHTYISYNIFTSG